MKKFFKALALVLALALVIGVVPAQATSAKIKAKKTLYAGENGATGTGEDGKLTSSYKNRVAIYKLAGAKKADKEDHKFTAKIKSGDSVTVSKNYVYAADLGKSVVELFKDGESLGTSVITVKKNATADTLTITEFEDGKEVVCGVEYTVTLPRKGVDTDERRLIVDDKAVADKEDAPRAYAVKFTTAGDHKVKYEAFQGGKLTDATASKEITVKAVMPQPVSAKQVSASSFAVEFEGNMEGLISKDDITNQMIYYLIASEPVVTGVIKSVEVKDKVVTVTMYSNFNSDTDYYFAYGSADAIKFHTAKNDIKYATAIKLIEEKAYYVGEETKVTYKFYNADGVELDITDQAATLDYDSDVAYLVGEKIYFFKEGTATIKASIVTGYDEETNAPIKLEDSLAVTGITKTATQTGKTYSFGQDPDKKATSLRITANGAADAVELQVKYTLADGNTQKLDSTTFVPTTDYYLRSADETIAMVAGANKNLVYGVNVGKTVIILCDKDGKDVDAFPIEILEKNHVTKANVAFSKDSLNLNDSLAADDGVNLVIEGIDLDGNADKNYTYTVKQADNNAAAVKVKYNSGNAVTEGTYAIAADGKATIPMAFGDFADTRDNKEAVAIVRFTVTVKVGSTTVLEKNIQLAVSNQATAKANAWRLSVTETSLDASVKNWKDKDLASYNSVLTASSVASVGGYDFFIAAEPFDIIEAVSDIPVTGTAAKNYVVAKYPDGGFVANTANDITVSAFKENGAIDLQGKTGSYTFTGYHAAYDANNKLIRSGMGTQSVTISKNDVKATFAILDGTAKGYSTKSLNEIFKVTWEGKTNETPAIVDIVDVDDYYDTSTESYLVKKIVVKVVVDSDATTPAFAFTQEIVVNKLFKDK